MKLRVVSFLLAIVVVVSVMLPAFAAGIGDGIEDTAEETVLPEETVVEPEIETEPEIEPEIEEPVPTSPFYVNGVNLADLEYVAIEGVNYVTIASFALAMNADAMVERLEDTIHVSAAVVTEVGVDEVAGAAVVEESTLSITAELGECYVCANGRYLYLEDGVSSIDGKIALPVRTLSRIYNLNVEWVDGAVQMNSIEGAGAFIESGDTYYDEEILYWLSRIIFSESGNQSMHGKLAVGNVVMNRLNDPGFPNTIKGVLFQKNQFSPAMSGSIYRDPGPASVIAAKLVMDGAVVLENALFFNRAGMNTFASRNRTYITTIGAHAFYA